MVRITAKSDTAEMTIQRRTPRRRGRAPTRARLLRESPAPMRNSVTVSPMRAAFTIRSHGSAIGEYVRTIVATTNQRMNQGMVIFAVRLKKNAVASVRGTIQSARVSFTVVAIASASATYFDAAPTTELVS